MFPSSTWNFAFCSLTPKQLEDMELYNVDPSEIIFKGTLFVSEFSRIFLVTVHNRTCVIVTSPN